MNMSAVSDVTGLAMICIRLSGSAFLFGFSSYSGVLNFHGLLPISDKTSLPFARRWRGARDGQYY